MNNSNEASKGLLLVISGPAGVGKGTVIKCLMKDPSYTYSVSATTRSPREGEINGVHYHFVNRDGFTDMIENGKMLEYAEYVGNFYGTPRLFVDAKLAEGKNVILEIETAGALQIKKKMPEAVLIFICPPSVTELEQRLRGRGTETDAVVRKRMEKSVSEMALICEYDYAVINGDGAYEKTAQDIAAIVRAEKLSVKRGYPRP